MNANPKNSSTIRESSDEGPVSILLESIGRALALSILSLVSRVTLAASDRGATEALLERPYRSPVPPNST